MTSQQLPLLAGQPRARASDPATSHEAAAAIQPALNAQCHRVLLLIARAEHRYPDGLTNDTYISQAFGIPRNIVARRRLDLEDIGFVQRDGTMQANGRRVVAYQTTDKARRWLESGIR